MAGIFGTDSDGRRWPVWLQEEDDTCGPSCAYMLEALRDKTNPVGGEKRIVEISKGLPHGYSEGNGMRVDNLKYVLQRIGFHAGLQRFSISSFLTEGKFPFIAHIQWYLGCGHYVVVAAPTKSRNLVCLDPWCGLVETPILALPSYTATRNIRVPASKDRITDGRFSGWVAYDERFATIDTGLARV